MQASGYCDKNKTRHSTFLSHHEGNRTAEDCVELFGDIERRRAIDSPIPVFTSDNWDPFEEGHLNVMVFLRRRLTAESEESLILYWFLTQI